MIELLPYLFYVFLAIIVSRSCAIIAARRLQEKRPGEQLLANLDILPTRDMTVMQDAVAACYAVLKESGVRGWPAYFAVVHVASWVIFGILILVMAIVGLVRQF